jgi:MFS family permease
MRWADYSVPCPEVALDSPAVPRLRLPAILREPNFARYLAAEAVSDLGSGMAMVALAFAVLEFGTATDLGIVLLAREIPIVVFVLLGGVFADRIPRQRLLVSSDLVKGVVQVATAILLATGSASVWSIALLQATFGVANAFSRPATLGFVKDVVSNERLQEANALLHALINVFSIAGPAIGALIVSAGSPALAIAIDAVTFFASAALNGSMRLARTALAAKTSIVGDLREGFRELVARPWAVATIASFGLFQLTFFPALTVLGPVVALDHLGGAAGWGALLALTSAGAVVGGLLSFRIRSSRPLVACQLAVLPAGVLLFGLAVPLSLAALAAISVAMGVGFAVSNTMYQTAFQRNLPEYALSRISSYDWFGSLALNPIGYALIGPIAAALGTSQTLYLAAVLNVLVCLSVLLVPSVRAIRMTPSSSPTEPISIAT